jgi:hypothetical protein
MDLPPLHRAKQYVLDRRIKITREEKGANKELIT